MSRSLTPPRRAQTLGYLLRSVYEALQARVYGSLHAAGFTDIRPAHSSVLRHLPESGARLTELARAAGMTKQSMAYLVDDLVAHGYLALAPDPDDQRAKLVRYTARGGTLLNTLLTESARAEADCADVIGADAMRSLRQSLACLSERAP